MEDRRQALEQAPEGKSRDVKPSTTAAVETERAT
eukprot:IDg17340t1